MVSLETGFLLGMQNLTSQLQQRNPVSGSRFLLTAAPIQRL